MSFNDPKIKTDAGVLFSGGMDSTTLLYYAKKIHFKVYAIIIDYEQRHKKEIDHAINICDNANIKYNIISITIPRYEGSPLVDSNSEIPSQEEQEQVSTVVPLRNSLFLLHACALAVSMQVKDIYIGAVADDQPVYLDCRPEFFEAFQELLNKQTIDITVRYPFVNKNKSKIVELGEILKVPWQLTWTCYKGGEKACGVCDACRERLHAFETNSLMDPIKYE